MLGFGGGYDEILDYQDGIDKLDFSALASVASVADLSVIQTSATAATLAYFDGVDDVNLKVVSTEPFFLDASDFLF